ERGLLGRRRSEPTRHGLQVERDGPGGREAAEAGDHPHRRDGGDECLHYDFSDSHTRLPPTTSYEPLPSPLQSQSRPAYVTLLHGAGRTHDFVFQTTSNWPSSRILPMWSGFHVWWFFSSTLSGRSVL